MKIFATVGAVAITQLKLELQVKRLQIASPIRPKLLQMVQFERIGFYLVYQRFN